MNALRQEYRGLRGTILPGAQVHFNFSRISQNERSQRRDPRSGQGSVTILFIRAKPAAVDSVLTSSFPVIVSKPLRKSGEVRKCHACTRGEDSARS